MTRKKFENTKWELNTTDGLWYNPNADKNCKKCNGFGVLDDGNNYGCILINCTICWLVEPRTAAGSLD